MRKEIKKRDTISEAIRKNPKVAEALFEEGIFCVGCHAAQFETIEEGCAAHGVDVNKILRKINDKKKTGKIKSKPEAKNKKKSKSK